MVVGRPGTKFVSDKHGGGTGSVRREESGLKDEGEREKGSEEEMTRVFFSVLLFRYFDCVASGFRWSCLSK